MDPCPDYGAPAMVLLGGKLNIKALRGRERAILYNVAVLIIADYGLGVACIFALANKVLMRGPCYFPCV